MPATSRHPEPQPLRVALLGLGTVGGAVASRLVDERWQEDVAARGLRAPELVAVGVREPSRQRPVTLPPAVETTDDLASLCTRDDIDVIVELLGGLEPAAHLAESALDSGHALVTANKALLAERGPALERAARHSGAALRFEAAVGAGTPILGPLARDLAASRLERVRGIVNGTTNFVLSAMYEEGGSYGDTLAEAQRRGYAEADPSADVEGRDAAHKLVLLVRLAFGVWLQPSSVRRSPAAVEGEGEPGITGVTAREVSAARGERLAIKLVASATRVRTPPAGTVSVFVEPCAAVRRSALGAVDGVTNVVEVTGQPVGRVLFQGAGAGGEATSSAVLADLLALSRGEGSTWAALPEALPSAEVEDGRSERSRWFHVDADGNGRVSEPMALDELRMRLVRAGTPSVTAIYRVLEET
jgi:homoserine dehydrogenase